MVQASFGHGWLDYTRPAQGLRVAAGIPLAPLQQLDVLRAFRPHVAMTFTKSMNVAAYAAMAIYGRRRIRWVVREGNNTQAMIDSEARAGAVRMALETAVRVTYRAADRVVAISDGVAAALARRFSVPPSRITTVHNPIDSVDVRRLAAMNDVGGEQPGYVLAAGRLEVQKGFDLLIRAFARAARDQPVRLVILGEGRELEPLRRLARDCGVGERVSFPGFVSNPWAYMARSSMFVLASRWEGFASVVAEAMACRTPVVVTDCEYGPSEIVENDRTGLVVRAEDVDALASAIARLLGSAAERQRLAEAGERRARDFDAPKIVKAYQDCFRQLAAAVRADRS
jgi:glycosyltransferase involved in cell wall biosynthesis